MATWTIGAVSVTRVEEQIGFASFPPEQYLAGFEREMLQRHLPWLVPHHYSPEHDRLVTSVHSWLIRTDRHTILVDCCGGNHKERPGLARFHQRDTPYLARLRTSTSCSAPICTPITSAGTRCCVMAAGSRPFRTPSICSPVPRTNTAIRVATPRRTPTRSAAAPIATACCR